MNERLPIYELEADLVERLPIERRLVVQAPTGSGKSTQVPQMLLDHGLLGDGMVIILQPRRLAARLLAARVACERNSPLGAAVGFQIRFENQSGPDTRIKYVTEGILLRQMIQDPDLRGVRALVFDEFHERHLYGDITLARALDLQQARRPDLLILVMSATLDMDVLETYLRPCVTLFSSGRVHPVEIEYLPHRIGAQGPPVWELAAEAWAGQVRAGETGDTLVFMPGGFEIQQTIEAIRQRPESRGRLLLPLHGELPPRDQDAAVARYDQPKVVVATNVAETSLTIDGIRLVIDSGLARIPRYDPHRGINTLWIERISQSAADQRAGRAGRTAPGRCIRLWAESEHSQHPARETPEIRRLDLSEVVLTLKAAGIADLRAFRWIEPPSEQGLRDAEILLTDLGALDPAGCITDIGRKMLAFPVHPRYARMLLAARDSRCVYQAALIAALTQGRDLLIRKPGREALERRQELWGDQGTSDFWCWMRAWSYAAKNGFRLEACRAAGVHALTARQVGPLLEHFLRIAEREGLPIQPEPVPDEAIQKCILAGFSDRVARRLDEGTLRCELVHGRRGVLARESVVQRSPLLVAAEIREIEGADQSAQTILSLATAIDPRWLAELFPEDCTTAPRLYYDATARRVCAEEQVRFRDLALSVRRIDPPPAGAAASLLAGEVLAGRLTLKSWDHSVDQWILRLNRLAQWCPELGLPPIADADRRHLVEQICQGAASYKDIKDREVKPTVKSWLSQAQQELLDRHAPERLTLSNGRQPRLTYGPDGPPHIALRIQELYDVDATPRIARNQVPVLIHILAPNMRPVQITQDLGRFWREHYPRVKQELQRKYPKHPWR
ncbi:MAG TPA: ATP-dependent helicase HrpB [Candidatus Paceibacterota bacterium]|mgnify:CR=1 FL=1|nr:ATP-dependent helicase HrpB [Verrucomicrobiota bacterium]HRZ45198.1 ATP-dependent helicase HrpB [Candidatus Paceibacterota bacterium]